VSGLTQASDGSDPVTPIDAPVLMPCRVAAEQQAQTMDRQLEQALAQTDLPTSIWSERFNLGLVARAAPVELPGRQGFGET
jgi:hypothetical protein